MLINVKDANDNKPEIILPPKNHSIVLSNAVSVGHVLLQIQAVDRDEGNNAHVSYYIASGNEGDCFEADEFNGNVFVAKPLDHISFKEFILALQVKSNLFLSILNL